MIIDGKFVVNGEVIPNGEAMRLVQRLYDDAKEMAGMFHNMNRSVKFRKNWPSEKRFANSEWRGFVEGARLMYTEMLAQSNKSDIEKMALFKALIVEKDVCDLLKAQGHEEDTRLQITKGTEQFEGSKDTNKKVVEDFGVNQNVRAVVADALQTLH